jgi:hypothetical protein
MFPNLNTTKILFGQKDEGSETSFVNQSSWRIIIFDIYISKSENAFVAPKDEGSETSFVDQSSRRIIIFKSKENFFCPEG